MRQNKSIITELARLLDRKAELEQASTETPASIREIIQQGTDPAHAAAEVQKAEATRIQNEITLEACCDRCIELFEELRERLRLERDKRVATAEAKLESDYLKWMSGDGVKLFPDEHVRARVFIFTSAADVGIAALHRAVSIPVLSERDFAWQTSEAVRPGRRELAQLSVHKNPIVQGGQRGNGFEDLPRLVEVLR